MFSLFCLVFYLVSCVLYQWHSPSIFYTPSPLLLLPPPPATNIYFCRATLLKVTFPHCIFLHLFSINLQLIFLGVFCFYFSPLTQVLPLMFHNLHHNSYKRFPCFILGGFQPLCQFFPPCISRIFLGD